MNNAVTRRRLLVRAGQATGAAAAWAAAGRWAWAQTSALGANDRIVLGLIGCGRRGTQLLDALLTQQDVTFSAVCDVDSQRAALAADKVEKSGRSRPQVVGDFKRMLESKDIHGVVITSPDHWHAIQLIVACQAGKDVYVEAPISHNALEGQAMIYATRKYHRVVQAGLQQRASLAFTEATEQIQSGKIGNVVQTRTWTFAKAKPIPPQPDGEPPAHLDYDRWIGPAPMRPYNAERVTGHFDHWWDYGGGMITRCNVHLQDVVHWAMRVNMPSSVVAVGGKLGLNDFRETPDTLEAVFEYDSLERTPAGRFIHTYSLRLTNAHAAWGRPSARPNGTDHDGTPIHYGTQFHGENGTMFVDRHRVAVLPNGGEQPEQPDKPDAGDASQKEDLLTMSHLADWLTCMRSRREPRAPIEAGHFALLPCHLANIAYRVGRKLYFDPKLNQCFTDREHASPDNAAAEMLKRTYRSPYTLPPV